MAVKNEKKTVPDKEVTVVTTRRVLSSDIFFTSNLLNEHKQFITKLMNGTLIVSNRKDWEIRLYMNTIHLHGHLSKFGNEFKLNVNTPAAAIHLLAVQLKDFTTALHQGSYHIRLGNTYLDKTTLHVN